MAGEGSWTWAQVGDAIGVHVLKTLASEEPLFMTIADLSIPLNFQLFSKFYSFDADSNPVEYFYDFRLTY